MKVKARPDAGYPIRAGEEAALQRFLRAVPALRVRPWTTCPSTAQGYGRPAVGGCAGLPTGSLALLVISKMTGLLEKRRCPGCRFFEWRGCQGPLGWLARPAAEGEDTGHPSGRSEPLTNSERLTLPALPGDVGQRPLNIPRQMPSGERCFRWKQHYGAAC